MIGQVEHGVCLVDLRRRHDAVRQAVLAGTGQSAQDHGRVWGSDLIQPTCIVLWPDPTETASRIVYYYHQSAGHRQERSARGLLQLAEKFEGSLHQGHVARIFVISLTDDARSA